MSWGKGREEETCAWEQQVISDRVTLLVNVIMNRGDEWANAAADGKVG